LKKKTNFGEEPLAKCPPGRLKRQPENETVMNLRYAWIIRMDGRRDWFRIVSSNW
jgi:hypothetical protein